MRYGLVCLRFRNAILERGVARLAVVAARGLFATVRRRLFYTDPALSPYTPPDGSTCIYSVWHDSILMPMFLGCHPKTKALVGRHQDGTFLANALAALGISSVRGSSSQGGAQAVRKLMDETSGYHIVMTPDGPRGPRRQMKTGTAFLSSHTGKQVVPTAFACTGSWSWGTGWTDLVVPKPGSTVVALSGKAFAIPPNASRNELNDYNSQIQNEMDRVNSIAEKVAAATKAGSAMPVELDQFFLSDNTRVAHC
jgi:lysophospholipid acyltransferase (LPLAT)-like uncharacterized protein